MKKLLMINSLIALAMGIFYWYPVVKRSSIVSPFFSHQVGMRKEPIVVKNMRFEEISLAQDFSLVGTIGEAFLSFGSADVLCTDLYVQFKQKEEAQGFLRSSSVVIDREKKTLVFPQDIYGTYQNFILSGLEGFFDINAYSGKISKNAKIKHPYFFIRSEQLFFDPIQEQIVCEGDNGVYSEFFIMRDKQPQH